MDNLNKEELIFKFKVEKENFSKNTEEKNKLYDDLCLCFNIVKITKKVTKSMDLDLFFKNKMFY